MEDATTAGGDKMVGKGCLAMIHMGKDANVSDLPGGCSPYPARSKSMERKNKKISEGGREGESPYLASSDRSRASIGT